jgi:D-lactate dehydrogenase
VHPPPDRRHSADAHEARRDAVYEEEADLFFRDLSDEVLHDDLFARLLTFPNVVITGHQAFFTVEALRAIAETTLANLDSFERRGHALHPVSVDYLA